MPVYGASEKPYQRGVVNLDFWHVVNIELPSEVQCTEAATIRSTKNAGNYRMLFFTKT